MFSPRNLIIAGVVLIAIALGPSGHGLWWLVGLPLAPAARRAARTRLRAGSPSATRPTAAHDGTRPARSAQPDPTPRPSRGLSRPLTRVGDDGGMTTLPPDRRAPREGPRRLPADARSASAASTPARPLLLEGPSGWGEFSPFVEYADAESARWLLAAHRGAYAVWPAPVRDAVAVNATVPAVGPERVPEVLARFDGCTTAKVKVAERGQTLDDDVDRVAAVRVPRWGPAARIRVDANGGWDVDDGRARRCGGSRHTTSSTPSSRAPRSRSSSSCESPGPQRDRRAHRRRRVDPQGRGPDPRRPRLGPPTSSSSRCAPLGGVRAGARDRRGVRAARRRVVGARHERRHRRRGGARRGAARRSTTRAGSARSASSSATSSADPWRPAGGLLAAGRAVPDPRGARRARGSAGPAAVVARPARPLPRRARRGRSRDDQGLPQRRPPPGGQHRTVPQTPGRAGSRRGRRGGGGCLHGARAPA